MKQIKTFIGLLIVVFILASCSTSDKVVTGNFIQKRKYNKGFYVTTKGRKDKTKGAYKKQLAEKSENLTKSQNNPKAIQNNNNDFVELNDNSLIALTDDSLIPTEDNFKISSNNHDDSIRTNIEQKHEKSKNKLHEKINKNTGKIKTSNAVNEGDPKIEWFGFSGLIIGLLGLFGGILPVNGLIAIILGVISLVRINKNPDKFKGKARAVAIVAIVLGSIEIILFIIGLILLYNM